MRKEERPSISANRKPLSSKSTNDDVASPKKRSRPTAVDEVTAAKADIPKPKTKPLREPARVKAKSAAAKAMEIEHKAEPVEVADTRAPDLGVPLVEPELLTPNSPEPTPVAEGTRGDTPPPADISSQGETSRASRRSRGVVSYAEPNLRDKMRRPTKDLVDAVTGSRRSSQFDLLDSHESVKTKRESSFEGFLEAQPEHQGPASPLAGKGSSAARQSASVGGRQHPSSAAVSEYAGEEEETVKDESAESIAMSDVDVYDFNTSSPQTGKQGKRRGGGRTARSSRRFSSALDNEDSFVAPERPSSRRRSMMI